MGKGKRSRDRRHGLANGQIMERRGTPAYGFCLDNTAANRALVRQITGQSPERFITPDGLLDSDYRQRKTAFPQASPCKPL